MVVICMYDSDGFMRETKENTYKYDEIDKITKECNDLGLETYQVNLKMNCKQIDVDKVFKLNIH